MNDTEAKSLKIGIMWIETLKKEVPYYQTANKSGDPRKSHLFKVCYKLVTETQGIIEDKDYKLYVLAQIQVLKSICDGDVHAMIEPGCLVGVKAWNRWKLWKSKYESYKARKVNQTEQIYSGNNSIIYSELNKTKSFMQDYFKRQPMEKDLDDTKLRLWLSYKKISPYYIVLSNWVKDKTKYGDLSVYRPNKEIKEYYEKEFSYEINSILET